MPGQVEDELWDTVRTRRRGLLATVGLDGMPHLTNVHYLAEDEARIVRITTTRDRVKGRNLLRDPRAALHVQDEKDWFAFAVAQGPVRVALAEAPGDEATNELHHIFTAFRGAQERPMFDQQMISKGRIIVHLTVDRLYGLLPQPASMGSV